MVVCGMIVVGVGNKYFWMFGCEMMFGCAKGILMYKLFISCFFLSDCMYVIVFRREKGIYYGSTQRTENYLSYATFLRIFRFLEYIYHYS